LSVRLLAAFGALWLGAAASAQSPFTNRDGSDAADTILPITSYPLGQAQLVAQGLARNVRMHWIEKQLCDEIGCLVVQNDTSNYKVAEFRIELVEDGGSRWSRNQLLHPLLPKQKLVRLKVAPAESCQRDIRFVLQHRKTKERLVMESSTNLCPTPHADNVIRLNVVRPEVTVEE
jgi:hypothetical protein